MAKKRSVASSKAGHEAELQPSDTRTLDPLAIAVALLAGLLVYVGYYPSDSVAVENGDALWFCFLALLISTICLTCAAGTNATHGNRLRPWNRIESIGLDLIPWMIAAWMMIAAVATSPPGNLRMATNEAWLWCAGAAVFTSSRRLLIPLPLRQSLWLLIVVVSVAFSVHGLHQAMISLPQTQREYLADPDRMLELIALDAPQGSAERMAFENRLFDGGPAATFALANSLAAVLLVGVIIALAMLRMRWTALAIRERLAWSAAVLLCLTTLWLTSSRSAALALVLSAALLWVVGSRSQRVRRRNVRISLAALALVGLSGLVASVWFGSREWFQQAPASLAFRLQYWRTTWRLVLDRPWFGAGPGNFKAIYERYREPSANEQIAEPHNFIFETMGSGGWIATALLVLLIIGVISISWRRLTENLDEGGAETKSPAGLETDQRQTRWFWLGAVLGLAMVWLLGMATGMLPDFAAHMFAIPVALVLAVLMWPSVRQLPTGQSDRIAALALVGLMIHLLVSGGWTVPGVVIFVWLMAAALTRFDPGGTQPIAAQTSGSAMIGTGASRIGTVSSRIGTGASHWRRRSMAVTGAALLISIYWLSIRPVDLCARAIAKTQFELGRHRFAAARESLEQALAADPWSSEAAIWLASDYRWTLIHDQDRPAVRQLWQRMLTEAKRRGGEDPAIYRTLGAQQIHLYQRYGRADDLQAALDTFCTAAQWSPASEWMAAQAAAVCSAAGQTQRASDWAERADYLSHLSPNMERSLQRQQIFDPVTIGQAARGGPRRRSASEVLANQLAAIIVQGQQ